MTECPDQNGDAYNKLYVTWLNPSKDNIQQHAAYHHTNDSTFLVVEHEQPSLLAF